MSDIVPADQIERIVGIPRGDETHYGRAVSAEQQVYVLHSRQCLAEHPDLRQCPFSLALDRGIDLERWTEDEAVSLRVDDDGRLVPWAVSS